MKPRGTGKRRGERICKSNGVPLFHEWGEASNPGRNAGLRPIDWREKLRM